MPSLIYKKIAIIRFKHICQKRNKSKLVKHSKIINIFYLLKRYVGPYQYSCVKRVVCVNTSDFQQFM